MKEYTFDYGDYFQIYHGHPNKFSITGGVNDQREDYIDGVQNPENLLNTKFVITESGLKAIYTNPDINNITNNQNIIGPMAPEKFPFKLKITPHNNGGIFNIIEKNETMILNSTNEEVYKLVLIGDNGEVKLRLDLNGNQWGNTIDYGRWNGYNYTYGDCLYVWHKEPSRSIIKGNINDQREDYSNGVDDIDNMNNVIFRLTSNGLESVYNKAPEINGANDIDVYQNQEFNVGKGVTYNDDYDTDHLTKSVSLKENGMIRTVTNTNSSNSGIDWNLDTHELGEKILIYTATDRWGKTTTVERKVTVRPNLYKIHLKYMLKMIIELMSHHQRV